jgi:hypothetical protein
MVREHLNILNHAPLGSEGQNFYQTRLDLLNFILYGQPTAREPPTDNASINDYLEREAKL